MALIASWILLVVMPAAHAQDYSFPAAPEHYGYFYPTAYVDEGGADWNCGNIYYSGHQGSDFGVGSWDGMDAGRRVVAAADGRVIATNDGEYDRCDSGACGDANYVILEHANGRRTWYWHLKQWSVAVAAGQYVTCGTTLGYVGSSGNSTGPHLHFEVREANGAMGDPFDGPCSAPPTYWVVQGDYGGLPGNTCPATEACAPAATIACGETLSTANNAAGATTSHAVYGCGEYSWTGSELAISFTTPVAEPVTLSLTGLGADLDLFVLTSAACDGTGAVGCSTSSKLSDESVTFDAAAGATYTVVVDGWEGAVSSFNLTASCTGGPDTTPTEPTGPTDDTASVDSAAPVTPGDPPGSQVVRTESGCGCAAGGMASGTAWLAITAAALVGRRRASRSEPG